MIDFTKKERLSIAERYKTYTCCDCRVKRSSSLIYPGTRICWFCYNEKYKFTKEQYIAMKKLNDELNKILNF